jgi:hypothetical protein
MYLFFTRIISQQVSFYIAVPTGNSKLTLIKYDKNTHLLTHTKEKVTHDTHTHFVLSYESNELLPQNNQDTVILLYGVPVSQHHGEKEVFISTTTYS